MFLRTSADDRPYHWGPYPLERLARDDALGAVEAARDPAAAPAPEGPPTGPLGQAARNYRGLFAGLVVGEEAARRAPVPDDPGRRMIDLKGYALFMNASQVGICRIPGSAWFQGADRPDHDHAVVVLVEHGRVPERTNPAHAWVAPAVGEVTDMRAAEIAVCLARHIRKMGFPARAHVAGASQLDFARLAVLAGLAVRDGDELRNPFLGDRFALAVVSTSYALAIDRPLAARAQAHGLALLVGHRRRHVRARAQPPRRARQPSEPLPHGDGAPRRAADDPDPRR